MLWSFQVATPLPSPGTSGTIHENCRIFCIFTETQGENSGSIISRRGGRENHVARLNSSSSIDLRSLVAHSIHSSVHTHDDEDQASGGARIGGSKVRTKPAGVLLGGVNGIFTLSRCILDSLRTQVRYRGRIKIERDTKRMDEKELRAKESLQKLGLEIADRWASGFQNRPTQQLVLQKIIDPIVKHVLQTMFPWMVGTAILFLVLLVCTVVTCVIVLRSSASVHPIVDVMASYSQHVV